MLPKKERLRREEFNRFFSEGKKIHSPSLQLIYTPNPEFHASVVVSKKVYSHAVKRNKLRRQVYDMVRRYCIQNGKLTGVYIFITKKSITENTFQETYNEVEMCIKKALKK